MTNNIKRPVTLAINSRPDSAGIVWFTLSETTGDPEQWGLRLANYLECSKALKVRTDCEGLYVGIETSDWEAEYTPESLQALSPVTDIVREISRFFTGHGDRARFYLATDSRINAGENTAQTVGPVLYFKFDRD